MGVHQQRKHLILVACIAVMINSSVCYVSSPVCKWNYTINQCQKNPEALINLLSWTRDDFAYMMSCEYASTQTMCTNIHRNACVWDQSGCHISARFLVNTISQCFSLNSGYYYQAHKCKQQLENAIKGHSWIDPKVPQPKNCGENLPFNNIKTCQLLDDTLDCIKTSIFQGQCSTLSYNTAASQLSRDVGYLFGKDFGSRSLEIKYLESKLYIKEGNLQLYQYCNVLQNSNCETLDSLETLGSLLKPQPSLRPPPPQPQHPPSASPTPSPFTSPSPSPTPSPSPQQKLLQNRMCYWDEIDETCRSNSHGLQDLLESTNTRFGNMMRCTLPIVYTEFMCKSFSNQACVWEELGYFDLPGLCHVSASYLVESISECFYPPSSTNFVETCVQQLRNNTAGHLWVDNKVSKVTSCQNLQGFQYKNPSCKLLEASLYCGKYYNNNNNNNNNHLSNITYYDKDYCEDMKLTSVHAMSHRLNSNLQYLMGRSSSTGSLTYKFLEENMNIPKGILELYDKCAKFTNEKDCQPKDKDDKKDKGSLIALIVIISTIVGIVVCCSFWYIARTNPSTVNRRGDRRRVHRYVALTQINSTVNVPQAITITGMLDQLPTFQQSEGQAKWMCTICLDDVQIDDFGTILPCAHTFHEKCFGQWAHTKGTSVTCPICNLSLSESMNNTDIITASTNRSQFGRTAGQPMQSSNRTRIAADASNRQIVTASYTRSAPNGEMS